MISRIGTLRSRKGVRSFSDDYGITLIELILVMAILALVAAVAAPRLTGFSEGRKYVGEWNRLTSVLRYARSQAISSGAPVKVEFDQDPVRYRLTEDKRTPGKTGLSIPATQSSNLESGDEHVLPNKLSFEFPEDVQRDDGHVYILFLPDGSVDEQSPSELRLVEVNGAFVRALEHDPVLGYVTPKAVHHESIEPTKI